MNSDEIYKFIGYAVVVIILIYVISKAFSLNVRLIEGMTTGSDSGTSTSKSKAGNADTIDQKEIENEIKLLQTKEDTLRDYFNVNKTTKPNYSALVDHLYNITNYRMLKLIIENSENINNKPDDTATLAAIKKINEMKEFMETLTFSYKTVEGLSDK